MNRLFEFQCWVKLMYRQGPKFREYLRNLEESSHFSPARLEQYQNFHLQKMIRHCYRNVPYYRDLFRQLKLRPGDIRTRQDLARLPYLDKASVKENYDKMIARGRKNFLCNVGSTSGSTGSPAKFLRDYSAINFENAATWRHWNNAGDTGKRRITLRGDIIVPASQSEPPFWKYNPANRELLMSGYHLSLQNSEAYINKIMEFRPEILYCYPSTAFLLAKFFREHDVQYRFDAIFTSSESLEDDVRESVEKTFQCRIYDWYGQAERVAAIAQCREGTFHIQEDYSIVELIDGEHGQELVGTHLFNFVMPLLRYRTRDFVRMGQPSAKCGCGTSFRTVEKIHGRTYSYLLTPEGYRISITNHIPRGVDNLIETQFYQEKPGEVVLKVLTNGHFTENDKARLVRNTIEHTSPNMRVIVKEVDELPRGPNGKFLSIINTLESVN